MYFWIEQMYVDSRMDLNYGDLVIRGLPWLSLQQHIAHGPAGLMNDSFFMKVTQFGNFFHLPAIRGKNQNRTSWKSWRMILQPVESAKNLAVKAGLFLKSLWDWWITFLSWCCVFRSKASAMLHRQGLKDSLYLHPSSTFTCDPQCIEKCVLEVCASCEVVWGVVSFLGLLRSIKAWTNCWETPGWYWDGAQQIREQGERAQLVQPGEEKAERDLGIYTNPIRAFREDGTSL